MIPSYFIQIDKFPLTPNGKVDKKSLPDPEVKPDKEYTAPKSGKEKIIANTWKNVLNLDKVSIYDNFFDIGGNSLNIIQVNSKLQEALEIEISIEKMFEYPTINSLANYLMLAEGDTCTTDKEIEHIDSIYDEAMHMMENAMQIIGEDKDG
jgi:acyl carrier protein